MAIARSRGDKVLDGGIIALMVVRQRAGRGTAAEAALSNDDPDAAAAAADPEGTPPSSLAKPHPRDSSPRGLASRFLGSTRWQALFVEWVILIVCACVVALRGLEYALFSVTPGLEAHASALHFPLRLRSGAPRGALTGKSVKAGPAVFCSAGHGTGREAYSIFPSGRV